MAPSHEMVLVTELLAAESVPGLGEPLLALLRVELCQLADVGLVELSDMLGVCKWEKEAGENAK